MGCRWWNLVREDSTNEWRFEIFSDRSVDFRGLSNLFWIVIWIFCGFWILKGVLNILEFRFG
jgi:hypothetical protein